MWEILFLHILSVYAHTSLTNKKVHEKFGDINKKT